MKEKHERISTLFSDKLETQMIKSKWSKIQCLFSLLVPQLLDTVATAKTGKK